MKRLLGPIALVLSMSSLANAACTTLPPKTWTGTIKGAQVTNYSERTWLWWKVANNCSFGGQESVFQGDTAYVFDIGSYASHKATITWAWDTPPANFVVGADFVSIRGYSSSCAQTGGASIAPAGISLTLWPNTKYIAAFPVSNDTQPARINAIKVTIKSTGVCG